MDSTALYDELERHLDKAPVGVPAAPSLTKILMILFPPQEARIALKLTFESRTLAELEELIPEVGEGLGEVLERMARKGTIFKQQKPGEEAKYRLLPSIVGFSETPFFSGEENERSRALAPLWISYLEEAYGEELARGVPLVRVIPISESLEDASEVLPFDELEKKVEGVSFAAVAHCPCRQMRRYVGEGCEHSLENCLHFGAMARYMVEQGMAREISREEVLRILKQADEEGLVHICDNYQGSVSTICNCCSCCCAFMQAKRIGGLDSFSPSNYVARVDADECVGCGTCEERCPMDATEVGDDGISVVDEELCIGCGVCVPGCDTGAVLLVRRKETKPPPELMEFVTARMEGK